MLELPVSPRKAEALRRRMESVGLRENDLEEQFVRSGGRGGQNVNRVRTCVVLRHTPSGILVRAETARTQGLNRYYARVQLVTRLEEQKHTTRSAAEQAREKVRRQKRRRSRRAKARTIAEKRARSAVKAGRAPLRQEEG